NLSVQRRRPMRSWHPRLPKASTAAAACSGFPRRATNRGQFAAQLFSSAPGGGHCFCGHGPVQLWLRILIRSVTNFFEPTALRERSSSPPILQGMWENEVGQVVTPRIINNYTMLVLDALFDHFQQISSNVEIKLGTEQTLLWQDALPQRVEDTRSARGVLPWLPEKFHAQIFCRGSFFLRNFSAPSMGG